MTEGPISPETKQATDIKRTNRVLLVLALLSAGWSIYGTTVNVNGFRSLAMVFVKFKIMLPGIALLFLEHQVVVDAFRLVLAGTCVYVTARDPNRGRTVYFNVAGIVAPLLIWLAQLTAFYSTTTVILESLYQQQVGGH
jgi:hypothetical protein